MQLLERHTQLAELEAARRDAGYGHGSVVLVAGDAGTGKTALVQQFGFDAAGTARVLWGMCDDLVLPRPLGPFRDMFPHLVEAVATSTEDAPQLARGTMAAFLDQVVGELNHPRHPVVAIVEDVHWGDDATLDAIRFLGRRIRRLPALLVVTYRSDEVSPDHPLRLALGAISAADIRRVRLEPLSKDAVARLAGRSDVAELYELTGGNPFYVGEMLAWPGGQVPPTVQDTVLARIRRLQPQARACVELVSVVPGRAERWLLDGCRVSSGLDEAVRAGVLRADADTARFPHELSRRAVDESLTPGRRREVNASVLEVLAPRGSEPARLVHHAVQAGDDDALVHHARVAADQAAALNCHREAVGHLEHALAHEDRLADRDRADLLDVYSRECELASVHAGAYRAAVRAVELREALADQTGLGRSLCRLASLEWALGQAVAARESAQRAVRVLSVLPPSLDLVQAYAQVARLAMIAHQPREAIAWGERAVALAGQLGSPETACPADVTVGMARWQLEPGASKPLLTALARSMECADSYSAGRAYVNLAHGHLRELDYGEAMRCVEEGLVYCETHDLMTAYDYLTATRAVCHLEQGRWPLAEADADRAAAAATEVAARLYALWTRTLLQARRADGSAAATWESVGQLARDIDDMLVLVQAGLVQAELAWLSGSADSSPDLTGLLALAQESGNARFIGAAAYWLYRAGRLDVAPAQAAEPYALQIAGRWREAAESWSALGRPYEQADALADAAEPGPLLEALDILDHLGAAARAAMVRRQLNRMGVGPVPRGPRQATRDSPAGLTPRQTEILVLLARNLTYQQIAARLHLSPKTVDHHVAAVRSKLDVSTRNEAVLMGRRLGILTPEDGDGANQR